MITNARVALKALKALKPSIMNIDFSSKKLSAVAPQVTEEVSEKKAVAKKAAPKKKAE